MIDIKLVITRGPGKGHEVTLKEEPFIVGSGSACALKLSGAHVSEEHAVLNKRTDGLWTVTNRSINGTLLNQKAVNTNTISPGDLIQIGSEILLKVEAVKEKKRSKKEKTKKEKSGNSLLQRPGVIAGVGFYLLVLAGLAVFLSGIDGKDKELRLSPEVAERTLQRTQNFLASDKVLKGISNIVVQPLDKNTDLSTQYYHLLAMAKKRQATGKEQPGEKEQQLIEKITTLAREHFFQAWSLEVQRKWKQAFIEYGKVMDVVPDIRVPVTQLAAFRRTKLEKWQ